MPPGAFLQSPARTRLDVLRQIDASPAIASRYARVFNTTPDAVRRAFSRVRLTRLKRDVVAPIHYVRPGERIGSRRRRLHRGTRVFVTPDGSPILVQVCGNPLKRRLRARVPLAGPPSDVFVPDFVIDEPLPAFTVPPIAFRPPEPTEAMPVEPAVEPAIESTPTPAPVMAPAPYVPELADVTPVAPTSPSRWPPGWIIVGGLPFIETGGGKPPVPEPPGLAMFAAAGCWVATVLRRRLTCRSGG